MSPASRFSHRPVSPAPYLLRCTIIVLMIVAAATFLHLNHYWPKQIFLSCDRPCHHLDWPMICRVKLILEEFNPANTLCKQCSSNKTECSIQHCNSNAKPNQLVIANRQIPGPSIQVCENDILVVDVINRLPGKAAALHWRGQTQIDTPFMDGAPLITQCPIPSYTTFQYKFRATVAGTHLWHAHSGADVKNGIFGSLIVKQADIRDPHRSLFDVDDPNHVLLLSQWRDPLSKDSSKVIMMVNGKEGIRTNGTHATELLTFNVKPGRRHRFRVANAAGPGSCPMVLSIDNHNLMLITLDGHPINPKSVTSIILAKGERADFILKADNSDQKSLHWLKLRATDRCRSTGTVKAALIQYKFGKEPSKDIAVEELEDIASNSVSSDDVTMTSSPTDKCENPQNLCVTEIQSNSKMPTEVSNPEVDVKIYLPINYTMKNTAFLGGGRVERKMWTLDNTTFTFPSSPLLTQSQDVEESMLCSGDKDQKTMPSMPNSNSDYCRRVSGNHCDCVHIRRVPLGATVEIILFDQAGLDDLVYHLHGYSFYVVGAKKFDRGLSLSEIEDLDKKDLLFTRNLECSPLKDTITVTKHSAVAIRFKADNPGYWLLRDEHAQEWTRGLDVILQIGEINDMIPAPSDFPKCGSFVGPDYFLI